MSKKLIAGIALSVFAFGAVLVSGLASADEAGEKAPYANNTVVKNDRPQDRSNTHLD